MIPEPTADQWTEADAATDRECSGYSGYTLAAMVNLWIERAVRERKLREAAEKVCEAEPCQGCLIDGFVHGCDRQEALTDWRRVKGG